ncbi:DUF6208 family protein, partial [Verrucomicrobia bacterium]|nr:DUF6208 family protein [Verrucomicrobiota bacterium]
MRIRVVNLPKLLLSVVSFVAFRGVHTFVYLIIFLRNRISAKNEASWIGFSELVAKPWGVFFLVVTAPRWNCHATIALTDAFRVKPNISLSSICAEKSNDSYSFVIYPERGVPLALPSVD